MDRSTSQYDSFLFWRQPIPELDPAELEDLGLADAAGRDRPPSEEEEEVSEATVATVVMATAAVSLCGVVLVPLTALSSLQDLLSQFSSFTFWRAPLADVDSLLADLNLLL